MIKYRNLRIIPTYHSNLDFVHEVRNQFYQEPPDIIAVEFPPNIEKLLFRGISRLPQISMILYYDEFLKQQLFVPVIPSDSMIEAIRLGHEYGLPIEFIDLFVKAYQPEILQMPDAYALNHLSINEFYNIIQKHLHLDKKAEVMIQNLRKNQLSEEKVADIEKDLLESEGTIQNPVGKNAEAWLKKAEKIDEVRNDHMAARLAQLMEENPSCTILVVLGMGHWATIKLLLEQKLYNTEISALETDMNAKFYNINEENLAKISMITPNVINQFNIFRQNQKTALDRLTSHQFDKIKIKKFDEFEAIKQILLNAEKSYKKMFDELISPHKNKSLIQYIRNLAIVEGRIRPQLFEIVLAAKAVITDDFAWLIWEECKKYHPGSIRRDDVEDIQLTKDGIILDGKYFKIRRSIPFHVHKIKLPLKNKPKEHNPGEWRGYWNQNRFSLVSYLPEDVFEENYFHHIRQRTLGLLKDEFVHIHEFKSTLMDGIDFRETIRKWPIERKIYVREERSIKGSVDAVVIIFDKDEERKAKYPYRMVWYAEHEEESDLLFYSTFPGVDLVGPGISRIELGGVVSFFPPRGVPNVWTKKFVKRYPMAESKSDRLLLAALIFSHKSFVTYVAKTKPKSIFYQIASIMGIKIIYLPLDHFNPISLRALRNLHVLAGKQTRKFADKYIKKRKY